jgi:hypothetical protein
MTRRQRAINKRIVTQQWGRKCRSYMAGCACCEAWRLHRQSGGHVPIFEEVSAAIDKANSEDERG